MLSEELQSSAMARSLPGPTVMESINFKSHEEAGNIVREQGTSLGRLEGSAGTDELHVVPMKRKRKRAAAYLLAAAARAQELRDILK